MELQSQHREAARQGLAGKAAGRGEEDQGRRGPSHNAHGKGSVVNESGAA